MLYLRFPANKRGRIIQRMPHGNISMRSFRIMQHVPCKVPYALVLPWSYRPPSRTRGMSDQRPKSRKTEIEIGGTGGGGSTRTASQKTCRAPMNETQVSTANNPTPMTRTISVVANFKPASAVVGLQPTERAPALGKKRRGKSNEISEGN